jgi:hypothetical protein
MITLNVKGWVHDPSGEAPFEVFRADKYPHLGLGYAPGWYWECTHYLHDSLQPFGPFKTSHQAYEHATSEGFGPEFWT